MDRRDVETTAERTAKLFSDDLCPKCRSMLMGDGTCIDCDARPVPVAPSSTVRKITKKRKRASKPREKKKPTLADLAARVAGGGR